MQRVIKISFKSRRCFPSLLGAQKVFNTEGLFRFILNKQIFAGRSEGKTKAEWKFEESKSKLSEFG